MNKAEFKELLATMSYEERERITKDYNEEMSINKLLKKYNLKLSLSQLNQLFLPLKTGYTCPYCNVPMLQNIYARTERGVYARKQDEYCNICGHLNNKYCGCDNCQETIQNNINKAHEELKILQKEKHEKIMKLWGRQKEFVRYEDLSCYQKVYLGILMNNSKSARFEIISPILESHICATFFGTNQMINILLKYRVIAVSENVNEKAFSSDGSVIENINTVEFVINIEDENILKKIYEGDIELNNEEKYNIWIQTAAQEVMQYFLHSVTRVRLYDFILNRKIIDILLLMVKNFAVSQCFSIVDRAVSKGLCKYVESSCTQRQAVDYIISFMERYTKNAVEKKWNLSKFNWPTAMPKCVASYYIYNKVLKLECDSFNTKPQIEHIKRGEQDSECLQPQLEDDGTFTSNDDATF